MNFTGERPSLERELSTSRSRYRDVVPFCRDRNVLDFGCGIGQGSFFLSAFANDVIGYDCDSAIIEEAKTTFQSLNVSFTDQFNDELLKDRNIIVAVEVIEHLEKDDLRDLVSLVSGSNTEIVATTPNGDSLVYRPKTKAERRGFHTWHYSEKELRDLFQFFFRFVSITGHVRDPQSGIHTGYTVFASNFLSWSDEWFKDPYMGIR